MTAETSKTHKSTTEKTVKKREAKPPATQETLAPEQVSLAAIFQQASADPRTLTSNHVLQLQRAAGNQAVGQLVQRAQNRVQPTIQMMGVPINDDEELEQEADTMGTIARYPLQAKLTVGAANDSYEQEADRVAAQVMSTPVHTPDVQRQGEEEEIQSKPLAASITPLIQRQSIPEEDEEKPLQGKFIQRIPGEEEEELLQGKLIQRQPGREEELQTKSTIEGRTFSPGADFESHLAATRGGGRPLPKTTRDFMEQHFGADFSGVRLHTGSESAQLNREVSAQAFTRGQDVYLGEGKENVESSTGRQLLAHELTHVVQQTGAQKKTGSCLQCLNQPVVQRLISAKDFKTATTLKWRGKSDSFFKRIYGKMDDYEAESLDTEKLRLLKEVLTEAEVWLASDAAKTSRRKGEVEHLVTELKTETSNLSPSEPVPSQTTIPSTTTPIVSSTATPAIAPTATPAVTSTAAPSAALPPVIAPPAVGDVTHPALQHGQQNDPVAVKELQSKLQNSASLKPYARPEISGEFDAKTKAAVIIFQHQQSLGETGTVDKDTWARLDTLQAVNIGRVEKTWRQHISGLNYETNSRFSWRINEREILVEVALHFENPDTLDVTAFGKAKAEAIRGINLRWNNFKAVKEGSSETRNIQFKITEGGGHTVNIRPGNDRSDANNWFAGDPVYRDVAAHEFGHLIGLADEYQMEEADYQTKHPGEAFPQATTAPTQDINHIADEIERYLAGNPATLPMAHLETWLNAAGVKMGENNGMAIRKAYETQHGGDLIDKLNAKYSTENKWNIVSLFTYSDEQSLMGTQIREPGKPVMVDPQPRHLNEFVTYVQKFYGGRWRAQKR